MNRPNPPLRSADARFDADGFESVKSDLQLLAASSAQRVAVRYGGGDRILVGVAGMAQVWAVSDTATAGSTGVAYHVVTLLRNGQSETGRQEDTRNGEIAQYSQLFLGQLTVSPGDVLRVNVAVTGAPVPTLSVANFSLRCDIAVEG